MSRIAIFFYGVISYAAFFATFVYAAGFLANWGVPKTIDSLPAGAESPAAGVAAAIDIALLSLFALQHSGMARPGFKRLFTRFVPEPMERSTYVLLSSAVLAFVCWQWQPLPEVVLQAEGLAVPLLHAVFALGLALVFYATILIDHFELFGLKQVTRHLRSQPKPESRFVTPSLYRYIRHPLYVGWFVVLWATPSLTIGHLLFAAVTTGYVAIAVHLEERDLTYALGEDYAEYRNVTPMFLPRPFGRAPSEAATGPLPRSQPVSATR